MKLRQDPRQRQRISVSLRTAVLSSTIFLMAAGGLIAWFQMGDAERAAASKEGRTGDVPFMAVKDFSAVRSNDRVKISWVTTGELNNDYFTILRNVENEKPEVIGKVNGAGASTLDLLYEFDDELPLDKPCFYTLRQTDASGRTQTLKPVPVLIDSMEFESRMHSLQPNPFRDHFKIGYSAQRSGLVEFVLTDISGKILDRANAIAGKGKNTVAFENLSDLPRGVYFLQMMEENGPPSVARITKTN